jgi:hypothetical protein
MTRHTAMVILMAVLLLAGCQWKSERDTSGTNAYGDGERIGTYVRRIIDEEYGNICYVYARSTSGGISCVPMQDSKEGQNE